MNAIVRRTAFAACFLLTPHALAAQQAPQRQPDIRANSLYTELLGNFGDLSFNYERLVGRATAVRIGYGTYSDAYGDCFGIGLVSACEGEIGVNVLGLTVSRLIGHRHMAEVGVGGAVGTLSDTFYPMFGESTTQKESVNTLTATIGYRFQGRGRWLVRAGYTPSYVVRGETENYSNHGFASMIGASFGFAF